MKRAEVTNHNTSSENSLESSVDSRIEAALRDFDGPHVIGNRVERLADGSRAMSMMRSVRRSVRGRGGVGAEAIGGRCGLGDAKAIGNARVRQLSFR
jgi:hypothetical protein